MGTRYSVRFGGDYVAAGSATGTLIRHPWAGAETAYPVTLGGVTLGRTDNDQALTVQDTPGWASGDDERLRGFWLASNGSAAQSVRIDLPEGAGDYLVWVPATARFYMRSRWVLRDGVGGPQRWTRNWGSNTVFGGDEPANLDQFLVNDSGALGPIDADFLTPEPTALTLTFASGTMEVVNGGHPDGIFFSFLSAVVFEKIDVAPSGPSAAVLRRRRTTVYL